MTTSETPLDEEHGGGEEIEISYKYVKREMNNGGRDDGNEEHLH